MRFVTMATTTMHGGGCNAAASGSDVQGQKSTLLDAAMKVEMGAEETSAIGGVMGEIRAEEGSDADSLYL